ncbi:DUF4352 domain-containing protein [Porcipelethomonas sp.]|uniref:DUF4352 domain-containing protein n=1 Tax=Porcipelethomonas sp. TaxID=2981675 RepID=UPI003EF15826
MKKLKSIIIAATVLVMAFPMAGCSDKKQGTANNVVYYDSNNSYVNPNDQQATLPTGEQRVEASIGTQADLKDYSVDLVKLVNVGTTGPDDVHAQEVNIYGAVFDITNNSDTAINVSSLSNFHVLLEDGSIIYGVTGTSMKRAEEALSDVPVFLGTEIGPGETASGFYAFEVPTGWSNFEINYFPEYADENYDSLVYKVTPDMVVEP